MIFKEDDKRNSNIVACVIIAISVFALIGIIGSYELRGSDLKQSHTITPKKKDNSVELAISPQFDINQLDILSRIVASESIPNHIEDMECVATVVMNRIEKGRFGQTMYSVVSKGAFDGYGTKRYWQKPTAKHLAAAKKVLLGYRSFDSDVLYYFNPNTATDRKFVEWASSQELVKTNSKKGTRFVHQYFKKKQCQIELIKIESGY